MAVKSITDTQMEFYDAQLIPAGTIKDRERAYLIAQGGTRLTNSDMQMELFGHVEEVLIT